MRYASEREITSSGNLNNKKTIKKKNQNPVRAYGMRAFLGEGGRVDPNEEINQGASGA